MSKAIVSKFLPYEKKLWKKGFSFVLGIDEVGRGAVAGPLVMAGVILDRKFDLRKERWLRSVKDSKKLNPEQRQRFFAIIERHPLIYWQTVKISPVIIDRINILEAVKLGIRRLIKKFKKNRRQVDFLILDGNLKINLQIPYNSIVKADEKILSCALASIIAKVKRDKIMINYHRKFPFFVFDKNKGYGTREHFLSLKKFGFSDIHRRSFLKKL